MDREKGRQSLGLGNCHHVHVICFMTSVSAAEYMADVASKMKLHCVVVGCSNRSGKPPGLAFHRFPKDSELHEVDCCSLSWKPSSELCSSVTSPAEICPGGQISAGGAMSIVSLALEIMTHFKGLVTQHRVPTGQLASYLSSLTNAAEIVNQHNMNVLHEPDCVELPAKSCLSSKFNFFFMLPLPTKADDEAWSPVVSLSIVPVWDEWWAAPLSPFMWNLQLWSRLSRLIVQRICSCFCSCIVVKWRCSPFLLHHCWWWKSLNLTSCSSSSYELNCSSYAHTGS